MEFLVMPQLTGSLIECYSASGGGCYCNAGLDCECHNGTKCTCNNGRSCTCNTGNTCTCLIVHAECPCLGVNNPDCPSVGCRLRCIADFGGHSTSPIV